MAVFAPDAGSGRTREAWIVSDLDGCQLTRALWAAPYPGPGSGDAARTWTKLADDCGGIVLDLADRPTKRDETFNQVLRAVEDRSLCVRRDGETVPAAVWVEARDFDEGRYQIGLIDARTGEELGFP